MFQVFSSSKFSYMKYKSHFTNFCVSKRSYLKKSRTRELNPGRQLSKGQPLDHRRLTNRDCNILARYPHPDIKSLNFCRDWNSHINFQDSNMPSSERKHLFDMVNQKNNFSDVLNSLNSGNSGVHREDITLQGQIVVISHTKLMPVSTKTSHVNASGVLFGNVSNIHIMTTQLFIHQCINAQMVNFLEKHWLSYMYSKYNSEERP